MEMIRAFVAVELSDELKRALRNVQAKLKDAPGAHEVRWVTPDNMHLPLKFLGDTAAARVPEFTAAFQQAVAGITPFDLTAHALGCFPNVRRPNVIWVGLEGDLSRLMELAKRIDDACARLGVPREERPFSPHLTLGRIRREARPADRAELGAAVEKFPRADYGPIHADAVHFIQSDLRPSGPVYTNLTTIQLAAEGM